MTLGVEFLLKALEVNGETVKLQIWDFAGEERFRFLFPSYIRGANGAIFMYDITNYGSLAHVDNWFEIVDNEIDYELPKQVVSNNDQYDMVIIAPNEYKTKLQPLINHKNDYGVKTFLKPVEEIYNEYPGRDKPEQIKYFITGGIAPVQKMQQQRLRLGHRGPQAWQ